MFEKLEIFQMAGAMARHAGARQAAISQNVAQADTPGYRAVDTASFADAWAKNDDFAPEATRPGHIRADAGGGMEMTLRDTPDGASPNGNTVSLEREMVRAAEVRQEHDTALAIYRSASSILRTSLGRR